MRPNKAPVILFLFIVSALHLTGQVTISGIVTDEKSMPLTDINILIYPTGTKWLAAFTTSDNNGKYSVTVDVKYDSLDVIASSIHFVKSSHRTANKSNSVSFVLTPDVKQLESFTVKATPIEKRGDTVSYLVSAFSKTKDRTIEDVLKRMPGIEVGNNGEILYQGMPIQKFYVEGLDLMDGRYGIVSKNLPQEAVSTVEIYENHQPLRILEDKVSSQQASLNLKLKNKRTTTGTGETGIGFWPLLWNVKLTPITFTKGYQLLSSYQTNNTGNNVAKQLKSLTSEPLGRYTNFPDELRNYLSLYSTIPPEIDEDRYLNNNIHLLNFNTLIKTGKSTQIRENVYYINDYQKSESSMLRSVFIPSDTLILNERISNSYFSQVVYCNTSFENNAKNNYTKNKLSFSAQWNKSEGMFANNSNSQVKQNLTSPLKTISNDFLVIHPLHKTFLEFASYVFIDNTNQSLIVSPGSFPQILNQGDIYEATRQDVSQKTALINNEAGLRFTYKNITTKLSCGATNQIQILNSDLALIKNAIESGAGIDFQNDLSSTKTIIFFNTELELKKLGAIFKINLPISWQQVLFKNSEIQNIEQPDGWFFDPGISGYYKLHGLWTFQGSWAIINRFGYNNLQNSGYILKDFQYLIRMNTLISKSSGTRYSASVSYKNPINSIFATALYLLSNTNNNLIFKTQLDHNGSIQLDACELPNKKLAHSIQTNISKFNGDYKFTLGVKTLFSYQKGKTLLNDNLLSTSNYIFNVKPFLDIRLFSWLDCEYIINLRKLATSIDKQSIQIRNYTSHKLNLYTLLRSRHQVNLSSELYSIGNRFYNFSDVTYRYSFQKPRIDAEVSWINIFNANSFIDYQAGSFSLYETIYTLRPSQLNLSIHFSF